MLVFVHLFITVLLLNSDELLTKLRVNNNGDLEIIGNINEGFYDFEVLAVDYDPNTSTVLRAKSKVSRFLMLDFYQNILNFIKN